MPRGFDEKTLWTTGCNPSSRSRLTAVAAGIPSTFASATRATGGVFAAGAVVALGVVTRETVTVVGDEATTVVVGDAFFLSSRVSSTAATTPPTTTTSRSSSHGQSSRSAQGPIGGGSGGGSAPSSTTRVSSVGCSRAGRLRRTTFMTLRFRRRTKMPNGLGTEHRVRALAREAGVGVAGGAGVAQLLGAGDQRSVRGAREGAARGDAPDADGSELGDGRSARQREHVHRHGDLGDEPPDLAEVGQPRRVDHVGTRVAVRDQPPDRVREVARAVEVVLAASGEDEPAAGRLCRRSDPLGGGVDVLDRA